MQYLTQYLTQCPKRPLRGTQYLTWLRAPRGGQVRYWVRYCIPRDARGMQYLTQYLTQYITQYPTQYLTWLRAQRALRESRLRYWMGYWVRYRVRYCIPRAAQGLHYLTQYLTQYRTLLFTRAPCGARRAPRGSRVSYWVRFWVRYCIPCARHAPRRGQVMCLVR